MALIAFIEVHPDIGIPLHPQHRAGIPLVIRRIKVRAGADSVRYVRSGQQADIIAPILRRSVRPAAIAGSRKRRPAKMSPELPMSG